MMRQAREFNSGYRIDTGPAGGRQFIHVTSPDGRHFAGDWPGAGEAIIPSTMDTSDREAIGNSCGDCGWPEFVVQPPPGPLSVPAAV